MGIDWLGLSLADQSLDGSREVPIAPDAVCNESHLDAPTLVGTGQSGQLIEQIS